MAKQQHNRGKDSRVTRGITLMETVLSLLILSGAFVAALTTIASARGAQAVIADRQLGTVLAENLMAEILAQASYQEGASLGPDAGESTGDRTAFDDIDDYDRWSSSPATDRDGNKLYPGMNYARSVEVTYVDPDDPDQTSVTDQGLKRIVVRVTHRSKQVAELIAYRSDVWQAAEEGY